MPPAMMDWNFRRNGQIAQQSRCPQAFRLLSPRTKLWKHLQGSRQNQDPTAPTRLRRTQKRSLPLRKVRRSSYRTSNQENSMLCCPVRQMTETPFQWSTGQQPTGTAPHAAKIRSIRRYCSNARNSWNHADLVSAGAYWDEVRNLVIFFHLTDCTRQSNSQPGSN